MPRGLEWDQAAQLRGARWRDLRELQLQRDEQQGSLGSDAGGPLWRLIDNTASGAPAGQRC